MADLPTISISTKTFPDFLGLPVKTLIGGIEVETALEQQHNDSAELTKHPVQAGAPITYHYYLNPSKVVLRCGWSNASLKAGIAILAGFFSGGTMSAATYIDGIYSQLLALRDTREPFSITTIRRKYDNMMFASIDLTTDRETAQALMIEAVLEQVIIVNTSTSTLPSQENLADPPSTAEVQSGGTTSLQSATPAPGGSLPPALWTAGQTIVSVLSGVGGG